MNEVIEKTYELLDYLDNSKIVKDLTTAKNKLLNNQDILKKIKKYQKYFKKVLTNTQMGVTIQLQKGNNIKHNTKCHSC